MDSASEEPLTPFWGAVFVMVVVAVLAAIAFFATPESAFPSSERHAAHSRSCPLNPECRVAQNDAEESRR